VSDSPVVLAHLSTVHPRIDTRVRDREIETLAREMGVPVHFYVMDGLGDAVESDGSVIIHDLGPRPRSRLLRMAIGPWRAYRALRAVRPQLVHFHDPELLPMAVLLGRLGIRVIYDAHENLPSQIMAKYWIPRWSRRAVAWGVGRIELGAAQRMDAVVVAWPGIAERFPGTRTIMVRNFPVRDELSATDPVAYRERSRAFVYVGGISEARGIREMTCAIDALAAVERGWPTLIVAGRFHPSSLEDEIALLPGWKRVEFTGWADRAQVAHILGRARAGMMTLHPTPNHIDSEPNKLFEYMAAGIPVIVSDFPRWREVVDTVGCGLLVDPSDPEAIAEAMQWILDHPDEAEAMGRRGRTAVEVTYNWDSEFRKLASLYRRLLPDLRPEQIASR
jgi:glycosyltransferase involved in cell wall biosynthesis